MSCRRYLFFLLLGGWEDDSDPGSPRRGLLQGPMQGRHATCARARPVEARQWGSVVRRGWGPEAGGSGGPDPLSFGWKGEGRGGKGREESAVGEGSV